MSTHIGQPRRRQAAAAAAACLLALASPAWPDAMSAQDDAGLAAAAALAARAERREPQRARRELAPAWGEAGPPLRSHLGEAEYGLPMPWGEEKFESLRESFLSPGGKKWLAAILARAKPYLPYVRERIRYYGLPDELAFLPVIESEYSSRNVSRSGAAGLWQFMRNSIGGYGMRIDDWVDERRDFMKSTDGALRKLADNYAAFGDWNLALAAYNCGAGALSRAIGAAKRKEIAEPSFWDLRDAGLLKRETANYVPKFLAVASILGYPGRHGLETAWEEPAAWATIAPGRPVDIKLLADESGLSYAVLRDANLELRYSVTPPGPSYELKVPADRAEAVRAIVEDTSRKLVRFYLHTVRSGDTLSEIARRYGTPVATIAGSNPGLQPDRIRLGQVIVVPALKDSPPPEPEGEEGQVPAFAASYVVAKGDTLWSLSLRYEVQPELLAERNGLTLASVLREGTSLRVPILKSTL